MPNDECFEGLITDGSVYLVMRDANTATRIFMER
jgi:hypothetical protein